MPMLFLKYIDLFLKEYTLQNNVTAWEAIVGCNFPMYNNIVLVVGPYR
jgi:hypothetical protein